MNKHHRKLVLSAAMVAAFAMSGPAAAITGLWSITDIGVQSGPGGGLLSLNDSGVMVGTTSVYATSSAFRWNATGLQLLGDFSYSIGIDVNASGDALISYRSNNYVVAPDGTTTIVPGIGTANNGYGEILDDGRVVSLGLAPGWTPAVTSNGSTQFVSGWGNDNAMNDVNGALQIATSVSSVEGGKAAIWQNGVNTLLDDGVASSSYADEINEAGNLVAGRLYHGTTSDVALWRDGVLENLGRMGLAPQTVPLDMNEAGVIVGASIINGHYDRAFMNDGTGFIDLSALEDVANAGWVLTTADAINNRGQIAGAGFHNGVLSTYLLTPAGITAVVPEPESWAMLVAGLGLIGGVAHRRSAKTS